MAGIYIHIPFCKQKCTYCDFHFSTTFEVYRSEMLDCIGLELKKRKDYLENEEVQTIYFGGGTPSILTEDELSRIMQTIESNHPIYASAEVTLEANPDNINEENLKAWKKVGINRLSIGIQSFRESDLKWMNRAHTADESQGCIQIAKANGFDNLTIDLIYGLPDLSLKEWEQHIQRVIDLDVPHISAYCLTVEKKTALHNWVSKGKTTMSTEDQQSDQFLILLEMMEKNGYEQYEISNFCKPGFESRHNSNYWKGVKYIGIGPSAHSFNGNSRQWNIANNTVYMKSLLKGGEFFEIENLSEVDQFNEHILTGLRTSYGVNMSLLQDCSPEFDDKVNDFIRVGWMIKKGDNLSLTKEGKLRADYLASELFKSN